MRLAVTSTPLHALTTLNDPTWAEAARVLAGRAMRASEDIDARLTFAFRTVLARPPRGNELALLRRMLGRQRGVYAADGGATAAATGVGDAPREVKLDPVEHAAMSAVCLAILNLDEALTHE